MTFENNFLCVYKIIKPQWPYHSYYCEASLKELISWISWTFRLVSFNRMSNGWIKSFRDTGKQERFYRSYGLLTRFTTISGEKQLTNKDCKDLAMSWMQKNCFKCQNHGALQKKEKFDHQNYISNAKRWFEKKCLNLRNFHEMVTGKGQTRFVEYDI